MSQKYNIEGGVDFFAELYKSLDADIDEENVVDENNLCLISNKPLKDKFVILECGHKFNYVELYNDLVKHKQIYNNMESNSGRLKANEIRCPYCRKKQNTIIPYYPELGLSKVTGVNVKKEYNYNCGYSHKCEALEVNPLFNPNGENPIESAYTYEKANCKFLKCSNVYADKIIDIHPLTSQPTNFGDEKMYCYYHRKRIIKKYKNEIKDNDKKSKQEANKKLKEDAKKVKEEEKQKLKEEKQKIKDELKKTVMEAKKKSTNTNANTNAKPKPKPKPKSKSNPTEYQVLVESNSPDGATFSDNYVLGPSGIDTNGHMSTSTTSTTSTINSSLCSEILKTGARKGAMCGLSCGTSGNNSGLCVRHYNLKNKKPV